ncbi:MAG: hypothetical protein A3G05_00720 [Candidatus Zambryskibacteria bacterium RIFCSPLOWO2_12_FULL_45_14]|uniref:Rod shape-determining protein MreD n=2 Tax=Candidatus Zambryskiibacteriota TaxID=1817925 RepID=A0A1G2UN99_9BACT|nr:MAG: hypothetical protein A3H60_01285 [Candidatus Zambryskibacteria bacterium RIFCSPLOWO2_02_FULL_44_12b]OHB14482.1 MAG: hypothetical protein A3G05_00720 [Candidatus Zambryskibacteria bacterium RIFCSPLOWO2_12_FULL_45_14]
MDTRKTILIASILVLFGILVRLLPHLPNSTPISAIAFASSIYLGRRWALSLPLLALFLSDIFIGFYDWKIMASVYGSFVLIGILSWLGRKYKNLFSIGFLVILAPIIFFLVTNTAVWLFSPWYTKDIAGLLYCYELGLPFLRNMFIGDVVYTTFLFSVFEYARIRTLSTVDIYPLGGILGVWIKRSR